MALVNIDDLIAAGTLTGAELLEILQSAANRKLTVDELKAFIVEYDNIGSGLTATDFQAAIDELAAITPPSTQGRHAIYIGAGGMQPTTVAGSATLAIVALAAGQPDVMTLDFDSTTQEHAQFSFVMPKKWNEGTITFIPHWSHAATTTNFGVAWGLQAVAVGNDDAMGVSYGSAQLSVDTGGTTDDLYSGPESSAITVAGTPGPEEMVFVRVFRNTTDGGDTMAIDARLHGVTIYVTTAADTDA